MTFVIGLPFLRIPEYPAAASRKVSHPKLLNLEGSLSLAPSKINTYDEPSTLVWRSSRDLKLDPEVLRGGKEQNSCTFCTA